ncbi:MAG TPA: DUF1857 family protein [Bacteroidia bacterium]|nr:DUF1857 family protein [Bacteroidia bacterium]
MISYSEIIKVPIEKVWEHFLYKIEHPEHFVPGASNAVIREKSSDYVIREMDIALPNGLNARISEKITYSPYNVKFQIIDHPIYKGHVDNLAEKISDNETQITYSLYWENKNTGEIVSNNDIVKNAVLKTADYILKSIKA